MTNRPPPLGLSVLFALPLYALLVLLGTISLAWNLIAMLLYPVLPVETGRKLGRSVIARAYRFFWAAASASGMMRIDASCLDGLRDERGLIFIANHPTMLAVPEMKSATSPPPSSASAAREKVGARGP